MRQAAPPNLIHSYDAGLMHGTLAYGRFYFKEEPDGSLTVAGHGIPFGPDFPLDADEPIDKPRYQIITIHDAFACLASDVDELREVLKMNLVSMYEYFDPFNRFLNDTTGDTPVHYVAPRDVRWVRESPNIFS
jgi:hypothetical protein